jgi:hypothetical protein
MLDMGLIKVEVNFAELREAFKVARERTKILDHLARYLKGAASDAIGDLMDAEGKLIGWVGYAYRGVKGCY